MGLLAENKFTIDVRETGLAGANLERANLSRALAGGVDFRNANLRNAKLVSTDLEKADLAGSDLTGADFTDANLRGSKLRGCNFEAVILDGTDITGADLTDSINLSAASLAKSIGDVKTRLPLGMNRPKHWAS